MTVKIFKDPGSAITHYLGMLLSLIGGVPFIIKAAQGSNLVLASSIIYIASMVLLYAASYTYHFYDISEKINKILKKIDHMMICILIAGTYTPYCLLVIRGTFGIVILSIIWSFALIGIIIKAFWVTCPKWFSSILYIGMGWTCIVALPRLYSGVNPAAFWWLLAGGIIYTIGGVIYALKIPWFEKKFKHFGLHEIFHLFVMGGSVCHYISLYFYVI